MTAILQDMTTWRFWRHFMIALFACLGALSTAIVINPSSKTLEGYSVLAAIVLLSAFGALGSCMSTLTTSCTISPDTAYEILQGSL